MSTLVELHDIHKVYDLGGTKVHALRGVSLAVGGGESVAIMGASGSGKSTLLNVVGCLDKPSEGTYRLIGQRVDRMSVEQLAGCRNRSLGFVFQSFNLLNKSTALENVELPMVYGGLRHRLRRRRAVEALELVGLEDRMHHMPFQLSGGQQQRVAIARALVNEPMVLLADEPTGNLDTRTSDELLAVLEDIRRQRELTLILVTHDPDVAACAERVVILSDGRVALDQPSPRCGGPEIPNPRRLGRSAVSEAAGVGP